MRILIVEDEPHATLKLKGMLSELLSGATFATCESVAQTAQWLSDHEKPDLAFFDIQLADGPSFELFSQCEIRFPVVFVTAFEEYVLKAFDYHSIHYLLKPVKRAQVEVALEKWTTLRETYAREQLGEMLKELSPTVSPTRLVVRKGMSNKPLDIQEVAYVFSEHKVSFVRSFEGQTYHTDDTLSGLEEQWSVLQFFRVNRQFLVNIKAIAGYRRDERSRIVLELDPNPSQDVAVSKELAPRFERWIRQV